MQYHDWRERGASAIEYAVMGLLIALALPVALGLVGTELNNLFTQAANAFN